MAEFSFLTFGAFMAIVFAVSMSGAYFKPGAWYDGLTKPSWNPPKWAFPVGWSILYILIAIAGTRVWSRLEGAELIIPFTVYGIQLALNAAWSGIFFGARRMGLALAECGLLWLSIAVNAVVFWQVDPVAGALLLPYLAWVTFAGALNYAILRLNSPAGQSA